MSCWELKGIAITNSSTAIERVSFPENPIAEVKMSLLRTFFSESAMATKNGIFTMLSVAAGPRRAEISTLRNISTIMNGNPYMISVKSVRYWNLNEGLGTEIYDQNDKTNLGIIKGKPEWKISDRINN